LHTNLSRQTRTNEPREERSGALGAGQNHVIGFRGIAGAAEKVGSVVELHEHAAQFGAHGQ